MHCVFSCILWKKDIKHRFINCLERAMLQNINKEINFSPSGAKFTPFPVGKGGGVYM